MQEEFKRIALKDLVPDPNQPRKHFDEEKLAELSRSVSQHGVLQPIIVRPTKSSNKKYMIVSGERRYRASQNAMLEEIPCVVKKLSDNEALDVQITENLQRENVNPMEEAEAFKNVLKIYSAKELAVRIGKKPDYVLQRVKLCELIPEFQQIVFADKMLLTQANHICRFSADVQKSFYDNAVPKDWQQMPSGWKLREIAFGNTTHKLDEAPFKTEDPDLFPKMGSCGKCRFNSFVTQLPFDGMENSRICSNPSCYEVKVTNSFKNKLSEAASNNEVVLVAGWTAGKEAESKLKAAEDLGKPIIGWNDWEELKAPAEKLSFEEYRKINKAQLAGKTPGQEMNVYDEYKEAHNATVKEYEHKLKHSKRAFVVASNHGPAEGMFINVYIPGSENDNGSPTEAEQLQNQVDVIRNNASKQIEGARIQYGKEIKKGLIDAIAYYDNETPIELKDCLGLLMVLMDASGQQHTEELKKDFGDENITDGSLLTNIESMGRTNFLYKWIRRLLITAVEINCSENIEKQIFFGLAQRYLPMWVDQQENILAQAEKNIRHKANEQIATLQQREIEAA